MKTPYTHICVVLDRSGSMESIREDTIGGFNAFVEQQKAAPGTATLSLIQFDTQGPFEVVLSFVPIREVPELTRRRFVPRGGTPLLDAVGRSINATEEGIVKMPEHQRPQTVIIAIVTDGQENSSREFKSSDIQLMIKAKESLLNWQFVFLSADLSAVSEAVESGIRSTRTMAFDKTPHGTGRAWATLSGKISDVRRGTSSEIDFTEDSSDDSTGDVPKKP